MFGIKKVIIYPHLDFGKWSIELIQWSVLFSPIKGVQNKKFNTFKVDPESGESYFNLELIDLRRVFSMEQLENLLQ